MRLRRRLRRLRHMRVLDLPIFKHCVVFVMCSIDLLHQSITTFFRINDAILLFQ